MGGLIDFWTTCVFKTGHALVYLVQLGPPRAAAEISILESLYSL